MNITSRIERKHAYLLAAFASVAVIVVYASLIFPLSLNIPYRDDFQDILIFVVEFSQSTTLVDAMSAFLHQHADHLTYSSRIFFYLTFLLQGEVDFRTLVVASHLGLLALIALFYLQSNSDSKLKPLLLVCICLLLLQPRAHGMILWPMASFQYFFVYAYCLAALFLLHQSGKMCFSAAIVCGILASFCMSTGQLVWVFGAISLVLRRKDIGKFYPVYLTTWIFAAVLVLIVFHWIFVPVWPTHLLLNAVLENPVVFVQFLLATLGSAVGMGSLLASQILGCIALPVSLAFLKEGWKKGLTPLHYFLLFSLASIGIIVLGRVLGYVIFDLKMEVHGLKPRYSFSSQMLWVTLFMLAVNRLQVLDFKKASLLLAGCTVFSICVYSAFLPQVEKHQQIRVSIFNKNGLASIDKQYPTEPTLKKAAELDIYTPPPRPYEH